MQAPDTCGARPGGCGDAAPPHASRETAPSHFSSFSVQTARFTNPALRDVWAPSFKSLRNDEDDDEELDVYRFESGVTARFTSSSRRRRESQATGALRLGKATYYARSASADLFAALVSSFCVAIPVTIIDRAIVQSVAGSVPLGRGLVSGVGELFSRQPIILQRPFWMVCGVYAATYMCANTFESAVARAEAQELEDERNLPEPFAAESGLNDGLEQDTSSAVKTLLLAKFLGVTAVNMGASVTKDRAFARIYGTIAPSRLPMVSWGCWVARDLLTIGAAFSLPKPLTAFLSKGDEQGNPPLMSPHAAGLAAQLLPVMLVQTLTTPLHIMANDYYNFKTGTPRVLHPETKALVSGEKTNAERLALLRREGPKTFVARILRIAPAFGIGGLCNARLRETGRVKLGVSLA